jgi:hypothetical protein
LDPEAWLELITIPDGIHNYGTIGIGGDFSFTAMPIHGIQEKIFTALGNRDIIIGWGPFSDSSIRYPDTLYLPAHDTTTYTIHY